MTCLHITNGDCAIDVMKKASIKGEFLAWRDVLHEGPVPCGLSFESLCQVRSNYLITQNFGNSDLIQQHYLELVDQLQQINRYDEIILWFEHDLYDQLHIMQILDWFNQQRIDPQKLSIICTDQYLGPLKPKQLLSLRNYQRSITTAHLKAASKFWKAFREPSPDVLFSLRDEASDLFPFFKGAVIRLLQEYPNVLNGLSRTENQALNILNTGVVLPRRVFGENQQKEERVFMGDLSFWAILQNLMDGSEPLIQFKDRNLNTLIDHLDERLEITSIGKKILENKISYTDIAKPDRWIGGVHLNQSNLWVWNEKLQQIQRFITAHSKSSLS